MKNAPQVAQKLEIYRILYRLNLSFSNIVAHCRALQQAGALTPKSSHRFQSFTQELQGEINAGILNPLHSAELADWYRYGKVRQRWEKYLRGPAPEEAKKRPRSKKQFTTDEH
jgi:hypothetical protein